MISNRYKKHVHKLKIGNHPKYIKEKIASLEKNHFGYDAFGLKNNTRFSKYEFLKSNKNTNQFNKIIIYGLSVFHSLFSLDRFFTMLNAHTRSNVPCISAVLRPLENFTP